MFYSDRTINVLMTDYTGTETRDLVLKLNKLNVEHFVTEKQVTFLQHIWVFFLNCLLILKNCGFVHC